MDGVQAPIIPVVGDIIRQVPGTISLGQGVVHYGPPPAALDAVARRARPTRRRTSIRTAPGMPALVDADRARSWRAENGIDVARGGRVMVTAGANMAFMHAVLAITEPGDEIILPVPFYFNHEMAIQMAGLPRRRGRRPTSAISCDSTRLRARDHRPHARDRHGLAEQSERRRVPRGARCARSTRSAAIAACTTSPTRSTSTSPTDRRGTCRRRRFPAPTAHTISMYSLSKAYGFAGWRIGYMVYPEHLARGDAEESRTRS